MLSSTDSHLSISNNSHSADIVATVPGAELLTLQTVLSALGFTDQQEEIQQAEKAAHEHTAPLVAALRAYQDDPEDLGLAQTVARLLRQAIIDTETELQHLHTLQAQYEREAAQEPVIASPPRSYWEQGRDWLVGNMRWLLGSTAQEEAAHYEELADKRRAQLSALQRFSAQLETQIQSRLSREDDVMETEVMTEEPAGESAELAEEDFLHQRRLLQTTNGSVTIVHPIPDQVIEATVEYRYDLSDVFAGDYTEIRVRQANGSDLPSWLHHDRRLGEYMTPGSAHDVQVIGSMAYVAADYAGLQILDVSNPAAITQLGSYETPDSAYDVQVIGSTAYVADYYSGLQVLDVSNPAAITKLGSYDTPGQALGVQVIGSTAYVADGDSSLRILNVSNPAAITKLGSYDTPGYAERVQVIGSTAYVADGSLQILDVSNPAAITKLGSYDTPGYPERVQVIGSTAYVAAGGSGLQILDLRGSPLVGTATQGRVGERYRLEVSAWSSGLLSVSDIFDLTVARLPRRVDTSLHTQSVAPGNSLALVWDSDVLFTEVSGAALQLSVTSTNLTRSASLTHTLVMRPTFVGSYDAPGYAYDVQVIDSTAYVADWESGLQILNVSNPSVITRLGGRNTPGKASAVQVIGTVAYVADGDAGLRILNVSNPAAITKLGSYDTPGSANGVQVIGSTAYVADGSLQVLDVSNPAAITKLGSYDAPGLARDVQVIGSTAYVAADNSGLQILDVSNPAVITQRGSYDTPGDARSVQVIGSTAYVADADSGLQILDLTQWEWTVSPTVAEVGNYDVTLTATNPLGGTASDRFLLRVEGPPQQQRPIPWQYAKVGQVFYYFIPQGLVTDPNLDTLSFSADLLNSTGLPAWLSFNGVSATFSGTPRSQDTGNLTVIITATDHIAGSIPLEMGLYVDHVPVVRQPIERQIAGVNVSFDFSLPNDTFVDDDRDPLIFNVTGATGAGFPAWLHFNASTQRLTGTPSVNETGTLELHVSVRDPVGAEASTPLTLVVEHFPQIDESLTPPIMGVGKGYRWVVPVNSFRDADDPILSFSAQRSEGGNLPNWLSFTPQTLLFSGTPPASDRGNLSIRVTVTDRYAVSVFQIVTFYIDYLPVVNQPPGMPVAGVGKLFNFTLPNNTFVDEDGEVLIFNATRLQGESLPAWLSFNPNTQQFLGTPTPGDVGVMELQVSVRDPIGAETSMPLKVVVEYFPEVARLLMAPVAGVDKVYRWTASGDSFHDVDDPVLSFSAQRSDGFPLPNWLSFIPQSLQFAGQPSASDRGECSIRLTATDRYGISIFQTVTIYVDYLPTVNRLLELQIAGVNAPFHFILPNNTFVDKDDDLLIFNVTRTSGEGLPAWLSFNPTTQQFWGTPAISDMGVVDLQVRARDPIGAEISTPLKMVVEHLPRVGTLRSAYRRDRSDIHLGSTHR
jgi:hypothetical protein